MPLVLRLFDGLAIQLRNSSFELGLSILFSSSEVGINMRITQCKQVLETVQDSSLSRPIQGKYLAYLLGNRELSGIKMSWLWVGVGVEWVSICEGGRVCFHKGL